jgi:hypothetical protein
VLDRYTPGQRREIQRGYTRAFRRIQRQSGETGHQAVRRVYQEADARTRQQFRQVFERSVRQEKRAREARTIRQTVRSTGMSRSHAKALMRAARATYVADTLKPGRRGKAKRRYSSRYHGGPTLAAILMGGAHPVKGMALSDIARAGGKLVKPAAQELIDLPAQTAVSTYLTGRALWESGATRYFPIVGQAIPQPKKRSAKRLKQLAHDFKEGDAIALAVQGRWKEAAAVAAKYPITTTLEIGGVARAPGLAAGAAMRRGSRRSRKAASTRREPARRPGTGIEVPRRWSRDPLVKLAQQAVERRRVGRADRLRREADRADAEGRAEVAGGLRRRAAQKDPRVAKTRRVQRVVDLTQDRAEQLRRKHRREVLEELTGEAEPRRVPGTRVRVGTRRRDGAVRRPISRPRGDVPAAAVVVRTQKGAAPGREGLKRYRDQVDREFNEGSLKADSREARAALAPKRRANRALVRELDRAIEGKTDWAAVERAANRYAEVVGSRDAELVRRRIITAHEAEISRLKPYAVTRMGARWDQEGTVRQRARERDIENELAVLEEDIRRHRAELRGATGKDRQRIRATIQRREAAQARLLTEKPKPQPGLVRRERDKAAAMVRLNDEMLAAVREASEARRRGDRDAEARALERGEDAERGLKRLQREGGAGDEIEVPLRAETIREHMDLAGEVGEPAYVSHKPRDTNAFFRSNEKPASVSRAVRTGEAFRTGTVRGDEQVMRESAARMQGLIDADDGFQQHGALAALHNSDGRIQTHDSFAEADRRARQLAEQGIDVVPVRMQPFVNRRGQLEEMLDGIDRELEATGRQTTHPVVEALDSALNGVDDGPGPWALWDKDYTDQLRSHLSLLGPKPGTKALQAFFGAFRRAALYTSPKWITGNVVEAIVRSAVRGAVPLYHNHVFRRAMRTVEQLYGPAVRESIEQMAKPGGHFGGLAARDIRRSADQFSPTTNLGKAARAWHAAWHSGRANPLRLPRRGWEIYSDFVVRANNAVEQYLQEAMAGRHIRQELIPPRAVANGARAYEDAARGLRGTAAQFALAEDVLRSYGAYSGFSPEKRGFIALYTPFGAWFANAIRFMYVTMPRHHPVLTGLIAANHSMTRDMREQIGATKFGAKGAVDILPDFLQGSILTPSGGRVRVSRYLPTGAAAEFPGNIADFFLPQIGDALKALEGKDWRGVELRKEDGSKYDSTELSFIALREMVLGSVPFANMVESIGRTGTRRALDPFAAIPPPKKRGPKAGDWNFGGSGGGSKPKSWNFNAQPSGASSGGGWSFK